ncbi:MAG TPA: hypothetical protein VFR46_06780 [Actinomycetes bacterium]|nr:hypothetical protein [Actinomycetes bacterium]
MQSHRWTAIKLEARKLIDAFPPVEKVSGAKVRYQAACRTQGISDSGTLALHDATEDGIPICAVD